MYIDFNILTQEVFNTAHNGLIHVLLAFVIFDIITGILKGFKLKIANSSKGIAGLLKHLVIVMLVVFADIYLPILGFSWMANSFVSFFVLQYVISVFENLGQCGVRLPRFLQSALYKLNDKMERDLEKTFYSSKEDKEDGLKS